jgi:peptidoglycan L-alanyl-D-glutamate endopeptidase CwlK
MFKLGARSLRKLEGVHPDLVAVVHHAITLTASDFTVLEGLRSMDRQQRLYERGTSQTMNSRHLTGHAVDLGYWLNGRVSWDWDGYYNIADAMKAAAGFLEVPLEWGGDWNFLKDGPHFQLPWGQYE